MCKHLMEAPYIHQVVDDPKLAASVGDRERLCSITERANVSS